MTDTISALLGGNWIDPDTGAPAKVAVKTVRIEDSLSGMEAALVKAQGLPPPFAVISDQNTYEALGRRVEEALESIGAVIPIRLPGRPHPDDRTAAQIMRAGLRAGTWIAVGSGTINDLAKLAAARQGKPYAVFATAPSMNGYTSANASITVDGHKKTIATRAPVAVFIDLTVFAAAPQRLIRAGFGDAICRTTAEADWRLSHLLLGTPFKTAPFALFADLEDELVSDPEALIAGDRVAIERLARVLVLSGFGMAIAGSSAPASQGEHLISHHLEMMSPADWDAPLHGEQIAVTTLVMAGLQETLLNTDRLILKPSLQTERDLQAHFGAAIGAECWAECAPKRFDAAAAGRLQDRLDKDWDGIRADIARRMRPRAGLYAALGKIGAARGPGELNIARNTFADAIWHARELRNRYTFLDLAADSGRLFPETLIA